MPNVHIHVDGEFMEKIQLERIQGSWGYCNKNASMKFIDTSHEPACDSLRLACAYPHVACDNYFYGGFIKFFFLQFKLI